MTPTTRRHGLLFLLFAVAAGPAPGADRVSIAVPGVPPVFSGLVAYVAKEEGFFNKHGGRGGSPPLRLRRRRRAGGGLREHRHCRWSPDAG